MNSFNVSLKQKGVKIQGTGDRNDYSGSVLNLIRLLLQCITCISVILELLFFPSWGNICGCIMMVVSLLLFSAFLDNYYVIERPFSFLMLLSGFGYHWLPVPAMLLEWKSVSYGMATPSKTFFLETLLFAIMCLAFYFASRTTKNNGFCKKLWNTLGMFDTPSSSVVWVIGILGCLGKIYFLANGGVEEGNIVSQFLNIWSAYIYIPVVLFFPCLYKNDPEEDVDFHQPLLWLYVVGICVLNLSTNSRNKVIWPFLIIVILYFISLVYCNKNAKQVFKPTKIFKYVMIAFVMLSLLTNISHAILLNRAIRSDLSFTELIKATVDTLVDNSFSESWANYNSNNFSDESYDKRWVETYLDNEWLNRFCNIRISDETLYYGAYLSEAEKERFRLDFLNRIFSTYPEPFIRLFSSTYDKSQYTTNSRGDMLYYYSGYGNRYSLGGFRVTSHLGDGMAGFGWWYFLLQFMLWYVVMRLLNTFLLCKKGMVKYSLFSLLNVYSFFLRFQNSNGMIIDVQYIIRGYWQECILFVATYFVIRQLVNSLKKAKSI